MPSIDPPELSDGDVIVRPVREEDLDAVTEACQDRDVQAWTLVPTPYRREDAERFLEMSREGFDRGTDAHMVVVDGGTGELLGASGLSVAWPDLRAELGYWTAAPARGRGVATRAARLVCRWGFDDLGLGRVTLRAAVENAGSNAVAGRLGFTLEGTLRAGSIRGHTGDPEDPRIDMNVYGLLPGELT